MEIEIRSEDFEPIGSDKYFIGISPSMQKLRASVAQAAASDSTVAIVGEQGSGRETVARLLHSLSLRSGFEFTRVNCAVLPEELLDREIFGSETGGAPELLKAKRGKLEASERGTLFLDEIAEMPLRLQSKLAQTIREGRFIRKDGAEFVQVDARVVVASSIPVSQAVAERRLLEGLARQLSACELRVPALRERKEELPFLSCYFMHRLAKRHGLPPRQIAQSVSEAWQRHNWPGNLRELEQSVKRYLVAGEEIFPLEQCLHDGNAEEPIRALSEPRNGNGQKKLRPQRGGICGYKSLRELLQSVKEEAERDAIAWALEATGWNRKAAARLLKTSYRSVLYKIEQYHMSSSDLSVASVEDGIDARETGSYPESRTGMHAVRVPGLNSSQ